MKNITFSADDALIEDARRKAAEANTTLNEEFRRWLLNYVRGHKRSEKAQQVIDNLRVTLDTSGRKFTRDEMNER